MGAAVKPARVTGVNPVSPILDPRLEESTDHPGILPTLPNLVNNVHIAHME